MLFLKILKKIYIIFILIIFILIIFILNLFVFFKNKYETTQLIKLESIEETIRLKSELSVVYFGRETCPFCNDFIKKINNYLSLNRNKIYYFDTDKFRNNDKFKYVLDLYEVSEVPDLVKLNNGMIEKYNGEDFSEFLSVNFQYNKFINRINVLNLIFLAILIVFVCMSLFYNRSSYILQSILYIINIYVLYLIYKLNFEFSDFVIEHNLTSRDNNLFYFILFCLIFLTSLQFFKKWRATYE